MKYLIYASVLTLITAGFALAGTAIPTVSAPTFTPWGTVITAAVLGAAGIYSFLRKKK